MLVKRETARGSNDFHLSYRPCKVDEVLGNQSIKNKMKNALDSNTVPHTQLFTGFAGCGKTSMARIVALGLNCDTNGPSSEPCLTCDSCMSILNKNNMDVVEINVGHEGGKAEVGKIVSSLPEAPYRAKHKVIIFDEAHLLTKAAEGLLLKDSEDGYSHVYLIFCTNHPEELKPEFIQRCSLIQFGRLSDEDVMKILVNICEFEGIVYKKTILDKIVENAGGIPRQGVVWLQAVASESTWSEEAVDEIINGINSKDEENIINISKLIHDRKFKEAVKLYDKVKMPAESVRAIMSGFFASRLKYAKKIGHGMKYSKILDFMTVPIYEKGKTADHKIYNYMFKATVIMGEINDR